MHVHKYKSVYCGYRINKLMNCVIAFQLSLRTFQIFYDMDFLTPVLENYFSLINFVLERKELSSLKAQGENERNTKKLSQRVLFRKKGKTFEGNQFSLNSKIRWNVFCIRSIKFRLRKKEKKINCNCLS